MKSISGETGFTECAPEGGASTGPAAIPACADPWTHAMRCGNFEEAWRISDAVLSRRAGVPCFHLPRHEQYLWNGESLAGKRVLVRCYHGLGDTIQFIRFVAPLRKITREVIVWAQPALIPLLRSAAGIDRLLPLHDGVPDASWDTDVELMELPHVFRTTLDTLPCSVPYLAIGDGTAPAAHDAPRPCHSPNHANNDPRAVLERNRPRGTRLRVGLVWQSGGWDDRRSLPTAKLAPLIQVGGIEWVALQQGPALDEWPAKWGRIASTNNVIELARRMRDLDLVLSVDSFPAHLAGALAVPTWTLLHSDPDWRWMLGRNDSPWYPGMRLWRQERAGEWGPVIARIAQALGEHHSPQEAETSAGGDPKKKPRIAPRLG